MSEKDAVNDPRALALLVERDALARDVVNLRKELSHIYGLLSKTDADRVATVSWLNEAVAERDALKHGIQNLRCELSHIYDLLSTTDSDRIAIAKQLTDALTQLGPVQFDANHYRTLRDSNRLIELDFPITPHCRDFSQSLSMERLKAHLVSREEDWRDVLQTFVRYGDYFRAIPLHRTKETAADDPCWRNDWLPGLDAISLYAFVAASDPAVYFEVGSGNSTLFVRRAIRDHRLRTKIISVDPAPRAEIDGICDVVHRCPLEHLDLSHLSTLSSNDIVFIDNSHRSFPGSDVTVFFMEVLGALPPGILYGLHDIFLPLDYPEEWAPRFYNEQYLLASYLLGGANGDRIVLPSSFVSKQNDLVACLDPIWKDPHLSGILPHGGSFWLRKANSP